MIVKIAPITLNNIYHKRNIENNQYDYSQYRVPVLNSNLQDKFVPSFSGSFVHLHKSTFRNYAQNRHIGCVYCKRHMFTNKERDSICKTFKDQPSAVFTTLMGSFFDYFDEAGIELLNKMDNMSMSYPKAKINKILQALSPASEDRLIDLQKQTFEQIINLKKLLPENSRSELERLIQNSYDCINGKAFIQEYSAKEFNYQLKKLSGALNKPQTTAYVNNMADLLTHPIYKAADKPLNNKIMSNVLRTTKSPHYNIDLTSNNAKEKVQLFIINKIKKAAENENNTTIINLCDVTKKRLLGQPAYSKFSNKAFTYKLNEILENSSSTDEIKEIFNNICNKLPKSSNSIDAFIVKNKDATNMAIINNLLDQYMVTIEHIVPSSKEGANDISNWALACKKCNGIHGSNDIKTNYPFDREAPQEYFNTIIDDCNNKNFFNPNDVKQMADNFYKITDIKVDLSKLKVD